MIRMCKAEACLSFGKTELSGYCGQCPDSRTWMSKVESLRLRYKALRLAEQKISEEKEAITNEMLDLF